MFRDVPALFATDGVSVDLVRAGEPRLRGGRRSTGGPVAKQAASAARVPLLRRTARLITS